MTSKLKTWEKATQELTDAFLKKYFPNDPYYFWVSEEIGGILFVNDYRFDIYRINEAMRLKPTKQIFFEYLDYEMECYWSGKEPEINFSNYCLNNSK